MLTNNKLPSFLAFMVLIALASSCKVYQDIPADISNNIPTIKDLDNYYDTLNLGRTEEYTEDKWILFMDRTGILKYEFDNEEDPFHRHTIYSYILEIDATAEEAAETLSNNVKAFTDAILEDGIEEMELRQFDLPGELHFIAEYSYEGEVFATLLVAQINNQVVTFYINAGQNELPGLIDRFLLPYLEYTANKAYRGFDRIAPMQTI